MSRDYLDLGNWNVACAQCQRKRKASEMKQLPPGTPGAGLYVCPEHWEPRHPQDFVRGIPDKPAAPFVQHQNDTFTGGDCDLYGISCLADWAVADCSICDYISPGLDIVDADLEIATEEDDTVLILTEDGLPIWA